MSDTNYEQYGGDGINATFHGLHKWYEHEFKHLGWMVLSQAKGNMLKLKCYEDSVNKLVMALGNKKNTVEEKDRREDLQILLENAKILQQFVNQYLMNPKMMIEQERIITGEQMAQQQQMKQVGQQGGRKNSRKKSRGSRGSRGSRRGSRRDTQRRNY